ncbi:MAG TPA: NAD(P)/FAD-dependent oxidoreductase [Dehalococcoidia bacterium]|nr:NAD(P)/FAD-dependent oxidoreductase [Dehalococcoidia bacterium]
MENEKYDVIIVGGGPNGLTAGAYLARAGARVLLIERRHETGGGLVSEDFSAFRFNLHAIYMMMMDVMPPYDDLDLYAEGCVYLQPEVQVSLLTKDGKALTLYRDLERSVESIKRFSSRDAERFRDVYLESKELAFEAIIPLTYTLPVPTLDFAAMLQQSDIGKKILDIGEKTPREIVDEWGFENPLLQTLVLHLICMWGLEPDVTGVGYLAPLYLNRMLNMSLIRGGSHRLSSALQRAIIASGGDVLESHTVTRIVVEDGTARGVEVGLTNAEELGRKTFEAKVVISSTDPLTTFTKLIPEDVMAPISIGCVETAKQWEWEHWSLFGLHLALKERPQFVAADFDPAVNEAFMKIIGYDSPEDFLAHLNGSGKGELGTAGHITVTSDVDPLQAPLDVQPGVATLRFESLVPYEPNEGKWDDIAASYGDRLLARIQEYAPNVDRTRIIRRYDNSPAYIEQKFANMVRGSFKHGAYDATQMGYMRPNIECSGYRTPVKNLYLCGASTYPGGMVLLGGGYNAARVVAEDLGIEPWWTEPDYIVRARERKLVP